MSDSPHPGDPAKKLGVDFNALYLDTNTLIAGNWPDPSLRFENLLVLTRWLRVSVFLPEPVEREAEQHWLREVRNSSAQLHSSIENFNRITRRVRGTAGGHAEDAKALLQRYRDLAASNSKRFGILTSAMTTQILAEFFDIAIRYAPPFVSDSGKKGKDFRMPLFSHPSSNT